MPSLESEGRKHVFGCLVSVCWLMRLLISSSPYTLVASLIISSSAGFIAMFPCLHCQSYSLCTIGQLEMYPKWSSCVIRSICAMPMLRNTWRSVPDFSNEVQSITSPHHLRGMRAKILRFIKALATVWQLVEVGA